MHLQISEVRGKQSGDRVPYLCSKKKGKEKGKKTSALGRKMDAQIVAHFTHTQAKNAAKESCYMLMSPQNTTVKRV